MLIKVIKSFNDKENDLAFRSVGTEFEVSDRRGQELIALGFAKRAEPEQPKRIRTKKTD